MQDSKILWITWEKQVRNKSLSSRMGADFVEILVAGGAVKRYVKSVCITIVKLYQRRRGIVVTQNPSLVLSFLALLLKPLFKYTLIVDAHNAGIYPTTASLQWIADFINRHANFIIVTNAALMARVKELGGNPILLPDPLPDVQHYLKRDEIRSIKSALFICSWASDEPYFEVFAAAEKLPQITFFVTGKSKGREKGYHTALPSNVTLTGYLPDEEYHDLLNNSDVIIDLTTRDNCLVCGAYEAVAASTPFVVSDTVALRHYFRSGGEFVANDAVSIAAGVEKVLANRSTYQQEIELFKTVVEREWNGMLSQAMVQIRA